MPSRQVHVPGPCFSRVLFCLSHSKPEKWWIVLAVCAAMLNGITFPAYSVLLSNIISFFYLPDAHEIHT